MNDILAMFEALEKRLSRLESSFDVHRKCYDTMSDEVFSMYKKITNLEANAEYFHSEFDDIETDIDLLYALTHACDNFCGNCAHCKLFPDGLYKCDITEAEIGLNTSSCIRFEHPRDKNEIAYCNHDNYNDFKDFCISDAEICKSCKYKGTEACHRCSHFPF